MVIVINNLPTGMLYYYYYTQRKQLSFSSARPYITQRGNTLSQPEKQHWFVTLLNFIAGWISSKTASVSVCLVFALARKRFVKARVDLYFILFCRTPYRASIPVNGVALEICWQRAHWSLLLNCDPYFLCAILLSQCHGMFPAKEDKTQVPSSKEPFSSGLCSGFRKAAGARLNALLISENY